MNKKEFLENLNLISFLSCYSKERIRYLHKIGDFTSIRIKLDTINDELQFTIDRMNNKQLVVNILETQKIVCNSMMDYVINMIEISYDMKREDEGKDVERTANTS